MWTYDGVRHRLDAGRSSIAITESAEPSFNLAVDVEVACAGRRWSATFFTPEQVRECLDRWASTGEALPGDYFEVPDAIVLSRLTLEAIDAVVSEHVVKDEAGMREPFKALDD